MDIRKAVADAKLENARNALALPHVYPEYQRVENAKRALAAAQRELTAAETAWIAFVKPAVDEKRRLSGRCQAGRDGDCNWDGCAAKDGCCPLPWGDDDDD